MMRSTSEQRVIRVVMVLITVSSLLLLGHSPILRMEFLNREME